MTRRKARSFAETAFLEAVAQRAHVQLILDPVTEKTRRRLTSTFLGMLGPDRLALDVPQAGGKKVFVPVGWVLGMAFPIQDFLLQARTTVLDHCQFPLHPERRVDALVVERPARIVSLNRRRRPRYSVDPVTFIPASLWAAEGLSSGKQPPARTGRVRDWSDGGLGIRLAESLPLEIGSKMIIRLEGPRWEAFRIYQGVFKHCTPLEEGQWLAGLGQVTELGPGQAAIMMESLVLPPE